MREKEKAHPFFPFPGWPTWLSPPLGGPARHASPGPPRSSTPSHSPCSAPPWPIPRPSSPVFALARAPSRCRAQRAPRRARRARSPYHVMPRPRPTPVLRIRRPSRARPAPRGQRACASAAPCHVPLPRGDNRRADHFGAHDAHARGAANPQRSSLPPPRPSPNFLAHSCPAPPALVAL
jgi:hypothetical protein